MGLEIDGRSSTFSEIRFRGVGTNRAEVYKDGSVLLEICEAIYLFHLYRARDDLRIIVCVSNDFHRFSKLCSLGTERG